MKLPKILMFIASVAICELAGVVGAIFTMPALRPGSGQAISWYASLIKPAINPPNWIFGPMWVALYFLMGVALFLVWAKKFNIESASGGTKAAWNPLSDKLWRGSWREENAVAIFIIQLVLNVLWPILFFEFKLPGVALVEILMLWAAIVYTVVNFYRISKPAAILLVPYLVWVTFAAYLNYVLFSLNR